MIFLVFLGELLAEDVSRTNFPRVASVSSRVFVYMFLHMSKMNCLSIVQLSLDTGVSWCTLGFSFDLEVVWTNFPDTLIVFSGLEG